MKKKLSRWKGLNGLTAHGRTIVANFLIFSQLRYWAQLMVIPEKIMNLTLKELDELLSILQETPRTTKERTNLVKRLEDYRLRVTTV